MGCARRMRWCARSACLGSSLTGTALQAAIREAVDANVLRIDSDDLAFRHALLREAVHDDLLPGEHQAMHVVAAEALRDEPSLMSPRRRASSLAHHWNAARVTPEALSAAYEAAGFAAGHVRLRRAAAAGERVLELWANVPDAAERLGTTLLDVEFDTGESAMAAGEYSRALAHFRVGAARGAAARRRPSMGARASPPRQAAPPPRAAGRGRRLEDGAGAGGAGAVGRTGC